MKKYVKKTFDDLDDILCDVCGSSCKKVYNIESASISVQWGYESKKDGQYFDVDLCESCFDKTIEFLSGIKGSPILPTSENNL